MMRYVLLVLVSAACASCVREASREQIDRSGEVIAMCTRELERHTGELLSAEIDHIYVDVFEHGYTLSFVHGEWGTFEKTSHDARIYWACGVSEGKVVFLGAPLRWPLIDQLEQYPFEDYDEDVMELLFIRANGKVEYRGSQPFDEKNLEKHTPEFIPDVLQANIPDTVYQADELIEPSRNSIDICLQQLQKYADNANIHEVNQVYVYAYQPTGDTLIIFTHGEMGSFARQSHDYRYILGCYIMDGKAVHLTGDPEQNEVLLQERESHVVLNSFRNVLQYGHEILFKGNGEKFEYYSSHPAEDFENNFDKHNPDSGFYPIRLMVRVTFH